MEEALGRAPRHGVLDLATVVIRHSISADAFSVRGKARHCDVIECGERELDTIYMGRNVAIGESIRFLQNLHHDVAAAAMPGTRIDLAA